MSSRNYDFQLNQPVRIRSLEAYRELGEALEEGRISLSDVAQSVEDVNNGATVEALRSAMPVFLEDGIYGQTYRQVKAVRACMEGALPRINALLSWCEQFQKELGSDTYVDLYVPPEGSNVPYNGGNQKAAPREKPQNRCHSLWYGD